MKLKVFLWRKTKDRRLIYLEFQSQRIKNQDILLVQQCVNSDHIWPSPTFSEFWRFLSKCLQMGTLVAISDWNSEIDRAFLDNRICWLEITAETFLPFFVFWHQRNWPTNRVISCTLQIELKSYHCVFFVPRKRSNFFEAIDSSDAYFAACIGVRFEIFHVMWRRAKFLLRFDMILLLN